MTLKKRGLGKGLDALLSNSHAASKKTHGRSGRCR